MHIFSTLYYKSITPDILYRYAYVFAFITAIKQPDFTAFYTAVNSSLTAANYSAHFAACKRTLVAAI
jgi:hypothetical protein